MLTDRDIFDVTRVPDSDLILHRHDEINAVSESLHPVLDGDRGRQTFIFGPSGTGKTLVARFVLRQLEEETTPARSLYVNCWRYHSPSGFLKTVARETGAKQTIQHSTPRQQLIEAINDNDDQPLILVLDEVDQLDDPGLLYDLREMGHVHLILVVNDETEFFAVLDDRLRSRLQTGERVRFETYSTEALTEILRKRAVAGLRTDSWADSHLRRIARLSENDARVAIETLRTAADLADRRGSGQLSTALITEAAPLARDELRQKAISNLTRRQRRIYEAVEDIGGQVAMGELYSRYMDAVEDPASRATVRRDLEKMEAYNLIEFQGEKRGRTYQAR